MSRKMKREAMGYCSISISSQESGSGVSHNELRIDSWSRVNRHPSEELRATGLLRGSLNVGTCHIIEEKRVNR